MAMFFQTTNTGKRGGRWAVEKAGPWKARKTKSRFSSLPTALGNPAKTAGFPLFPQPRLLAISQTTSGNLIVVDRKECLTPDTVRHARAGNVGIGGGLNCFTGCRLESRCLADRQSRRSFTISMNNST